MSCHVCLYDRAMGEEEAKKTLTEISEGLDQALKVCMYVEPHTYIYIPTYLYTSISPVFRV